MKNSLCVNDDQRWQSVLERDSDADGQFVFAVQTTGIFCRPSCTAKHALRKNVRFFPDAQAALMAGFRPCKRCQPDKANARQHRLDKITLACQLLEQESPITLDALAEQVAMSPYHLHRVFKATTGMTPSVAAGVSRPPPARRPEPRRKRDAGDSECRIPGQQQLLS